MKKRINKITKILFFIFLVFTITCPILYNIIGSRVLDDGTLDEPFYLVIFMYLFGLLTLITLIINLITRRKENNYE